MLGAGVGVESIVSGHSSVTDVAVPGELIEELAERRAPLRPPDPYPVP